MNQMQRQVQTRSWLTEHNTSAKVWAGREHTQHNCQFNSCYSECHQQLQNHEESCHFVHLMLPRRNFWATAVRNAAVVVGENLQGVHNEDQRRKHRHRHRLAWFHCHKKKISSAKKGNYRGFSESKSGHKQLAEDPLELLTNLYLTQSFNW